MDEKIIVGIIAGTVSLVVSIGTTLLTIQKIKSERRKQERELERKLTEKLYDRRIEAYPSAFSITQELVGYIIPDKTFNKKKATKILNELVEWQSGDASFILSRNSLKAFYKLRESLMIEPTDGLLYSEKQKKEIWKSKNSFRKSLRNDVHLLFKEDVEELENNNA